MEAASNEMASPEITCESMAVTMRPSNNAPQALSGMSEQMGAEVESQMYASVSLLTPFLSQSGFATVPAIKEVMEDSMNMTTPMTYAKSMAPLGESIFSDLALKYVTKRLTAPESVSSLMMAPIISAKRRVLAIQPSDKRAMIPSKRATNAVKGL